MAVRLPLNAIDGDIQHMYTKIVCMRSVARSRQDIRPSKSTIRLLDNENSCLNRRNGAQPYKTSIILSVSSNLSNFLIKYDCLLFLYLLETKLQYSRCKFNETVP